MNISEEMDKIIVENTICPYHKMEDQELHRKFAGHSGCEAHGHCLNPIQCTLFKSCPTNKIPLNKFVNMFLGIK